MNKFLSIFCITAATACFAGGDEPPEDGSVVPLPTPVPSLVCNCPEKCQDDVTPPVGNEGEESETPVVVDDNTAAFVGGPGDETGNGEEVPAEGSEEIVSFSKMNPPDEEGSHILSLNPPTDEDPVVGDDEASEDANA